jgi:hypothetical protein
MSKQQAFREITKWEDGKTAINHRYLLDGDQMIAYIKYGTDMPIYFKTPIRIDRRGRRFEQLEVNPFDDIFLVQPADSVIEIQGSKGAKYLLDSVERTCTCPGYTYRGTCKHVKELELA